MLGASTLKRLFMGKRFAALLLAFFVSAQLLATTHAAAYGETDHLHDGHPCIIASIAKVSADYDLATAPALEPRNKVRCGVEIVEYAAPEVKHTGYAPARAPPAA